MLRYFAPSFMIILLAANSVAAAECDTRIPPGSNSAVVERALACLNARITALESTVQKSQGQGQQSTTEKPDTSITRRLILDNQYISVFSNGASKDRSGVAVTFDVTNKTDQDILIAGEAQSAVAADAHGKSASTSNVNLPVSSRTSAINDKDRFSVLSSGATKLISFQMINSDLTGQDFTFSANILCFVGDSKVRSYSLRWKFSVEKDN